MLLLSELLFFFCFLICFSSCLFILPLFVGVVFVLIFFFLINAVGGILIVVYQSRTTKNPISRLCSHSGGFFMTTPTQPCSAVMHMVIQISLILFLFWGSSFPLGFSVAAEKASDGLMTE